VQDLCGKCGMCPGLWVGALAVDGKMILKCILGRGSRRGLTFLLQPVTGDQWSVKTCEENASQRA
jgi:hypothetical protein